MDIKSITNDTLFSHDWAKSDRALMLNSITRKWPLKPKLCAARNSGSSGWMEDVSGSDDRSVKAQLAGRRSIRAVWWSFFRAMHQLQTGKPSLEQSMFAFHKMHHAVTLFSVEFLKDLVQLSEAIRNSGLAHATGTYMSDLRQGIESDIYK